MRTLCLLLLASASHAQAPEARPGDLALAVRVGVVADTLRAEARMTNGSRRTVRVGFGDCALRLVGRRAAPDGSVADTAVVWDTRRAGPPEGDGQNACLLYLAVGQLALGEALRSDRSEMTLALPASFILPDSVAGGLFRVEARFEVGGVEPQNGPQPDLVADAGALWLDPPRAPVGSAAVRHGLPFRVASWTLAGGSGGRRLAADIRATPRPYRETSVVGFDSCAVRIAAFASAADLAEAPRRAPVASVLAACGQGRPEPRPTSDGRVYLVGIETSVALAPEVDLGALRLTPGTWWIGADVRPVGGFFSPVPLAPVWLGLGPVVVR